MSDRMTYEEWLPGYEWQPPKPKCECGTQSVYPNAEDSQHSEYCPVYKKWMESKDVNKRLEEMYSLPF